MSLEALMASSDEELAAIDPVTQNLTVAKGIPALSNHDIGLYQRQVDLWVADIVRQLPGWEAAFHKQPAKWQNDIHLFRLGLLCYYTAKFLHIRYRDDQRDLKQVYYTDPSDLFLNGVIDTRQGTCGNMAALHLAMGWRLGWPVSLAVAWCHQFLRFDNGEVVWNIESSNTDGGFRAHPDSYYMEQYHIVPQFIRAGSDLTFLKPRQVLGLFVGNRARHWYDCSEMEAARDDSRLALSLYPQGRAILFVGECAQTAAAVGSKMPPPLSRAEARKLENSAMVGATFRHAANDPHPSVWIKQRMNGKARRAFELGLEHLSHLANRGVEGDVRQ
jgi:hypothetical protein